MVHFPDPLRFLYPVRDLFFQMLIAVESRASMPNAVFLTVVAGTGVVCAWQQKAPQMDWQQKSCMGDLPTARSGHSFSLVTAATGGSVMYMFGGRDLASHGFRALRTKLPSLCQPRRVHQHVQAAGSMQ